MNAMRNALAQAGVTKAQPMLVLVLVEDYSTQPTRLVKEYTFDYNDEKQRRVFAAQAHSALEAGQAVSTIKVQA